MAADLIPFGGPKDKQRELRLPAYPCPTCSWPLIKYIYPDPDGGGIGAADARWVYYWCCDRCEVLGYPAAYTEGTPPPPPDATKKGKGKAC